MEFSVVVQGSHGSLTFDDSVAGSAAGYCRQMRGSHQSKCQAHYISLFTNLDDKPLKFFPCPYGLSTTGPVTWSATRRVFYGFRLKQYAHCAAEDAISNVPVTTEDVIRKYIEFIANAIAEVKEFESSALELAIHDARHLNQAITVNAEQLLASYGYDQRDEWNMEALRQNDAHRRALSIFAASRDLSLALSMHEVARDASTASDSPQQFHLHKTFFKQKQISLERLAKKGLKLEIQNSAKIVTFSRAFGLLPKILIDNAIKYAGNNSEIRISFIESREVFKIECINHGPIVRDDELEKVFERRIRGSNRSGTEGGGIGLWLARLIVEANGGTIKMEATKGGKDLGGRKIGMTRIIIAFIGQR